MRHAAASALCRRIRGLIMRAKCPFPSSALPRCPATAILNPKLNLISVVAVWRCGEVKRCRGLACLVLLALRRSTRLACVVEVLFLVVSHILIVSCVCGRAHGRRRSNVRSGDTASCPVTSRATLSPLAICRVLLVLLARSTLGLFPLASPTSMTFLRAVISRYGEKGRGKEAGMGVKGGRKATCAPLACATLAVRRLLDGARS